MLCVISKISRKKKCCYREKRIAKKFQCIQAFRESFSQSNKVSPDGYWLGRTGKAFGRSDTRFWESIIMKIYMSEDYYRIWVLIRYAFKPSEIATIMGKTRGAITKTKHILLVKLFHVDGNSSELGVRLMDVLWPSDDPLRCSLLLALLHAQQKNEGATLPPTAVGGVGLLPRV